MIEKQTANCKLQTRSKKQVTNQPDFLLQGTFNSFLSKRTQNRRRNDEKSRRSPKQA